MYVCIYVYVCMYVCLVNCFGDFISRIQINDYQGVCEILRKTNSGSHAAFMNVS